MAVLLVNAAPVLEAAGGIIARPLLAGAPISNFVEYYANAS
jgi:hypothetical protein